MRNDGQNKIFFIFVK